MPIPGLIQSKVWQPTNLTDVFFTDNQYSGFSFEPHFHEHWIIQIVGEGVNEGICSRIKYRASTNELVFINPGEIHTGSSWEARPMRYMTICPSIPFIQRVLAQMEYSPAMLPSFTSLHVRDAVALEQAQHFWALSQFAEFDVLALESAMLELFSTLFSRYANCKPPIQVYPEKNRVQQIKNFLRENYTRVISLTELSQELEISPTHLLRSFQKETGQTPFTYLRNYRIEQSKPRLLRGQPISEVALQVGFYDQSHFHLHFKRVVGITPRRFRLNEKL